MKHTLSFLFLLNIVFSTAENINPTSMSSTQGITLSGGQNETYFGFSVSNAGDINGDGIDDILLGNANYNNYMGSLYVIYGGNDIADLTVDDTLDNSKGFIIYAASPGERLGTSVIALGDINGDNVDDFGFGALGANSWMGAFYVIYGRKSAFANIDLSYGLNSTQGFVLIGTFGTKGAALVGSLAGDVNDDGISDIMLGFPYWNDYQGIVFIIYGTGENSPNITLDVELDSSIGFVIKGPRLSFSFGMSLSTAGDINDDGVDDVVIGACSMQYGIAYVLYGQKGGQANIDLNYGLNLTQGFAITGSSISGYLGYSVSSAGDVNNDGIADIVIGAPLENTNGSVYIVYGKKGGHANISATDSSLLTKISSIDAPGLGRSVASAGDINHDGIDDILILRNGQVSSVVEAGTAVTFTFYGSNSGGGKIADTVLDSTEGLTITSDLLTIFLEQRFSIGDFNNDFLPDIIIGSPYARNGQGSAYIIFGSNGCSKNCAKCSSLAVCETCFGNFGLYKFECVATCPKGTYFSVGHCINCPEGCAECTSSSVCQLCTGSFVLLNSQRCISDSKSSQTNITGAAFDGAAVLGNSIAVGTSLPTNFGLVAKILRNIRYMNITVSSDLEETFYTWKISTGFISMPESWNDYSEPEMLPEVFERYNLGSLFLVNYWKNLLMIVIGLSLYVIFRLLDLKSCRKKKKKIEVGKMRAALRSLNVFASNFTLTQVYGSLDDIIFFFVLQTRSADFHIDFGRASFALSVVLVLFGIIIVGVHILILHRYQRSLRAAKDKSSQELKKFLEKHENFKMLFQDFKDTNLMKQSFLLIYVGRSVISNIIITTLFAYPLLQSLLLTSLNILILVYLVVSRPFKEKLNATGQYFCEIILLFVNVSMLAMAILDNASFVDRFSQLVIIMNMTLVIGSLVFMLLSVGKTLYIFYKEKKAEKKQQKNKEKVKGFGGEKNSLKIIAPPRIKITGVLNQDQSICDPLNLSGGHSFLEIPSSVHINNNLFGMIPSQNLSEISPQLNNQNLDGRSRVVPMKISESESSPPFGGIKMTHVSQSNESYVIPYIVSNNLNSGGVKNLTLERGNKDEVEKQDFLQNSSMAIYESQQDQGTAGQRERNRENLKFIGRKIRRGPNIKIKRINE